MYNLSHYKLHWYIQLHKSIKALQLILKCSHQYYFKYELQQWDQFLCAVRIFPLVAKIRNGNSTSQKLVVGGKNTQYWGLQGFGLDIVKDTGKIVLQ